jgi:hypothetical protein
MSMDGRPLTVGKVVIAVAVLLVGAPIAKIFMRRFAHRVFTRIGFEHGAAAAFETLGFYGIIVCLVVFALWLSEIPLTIFTLAGGALAIGIGFGSQAYRGDGDLRRPGDGMLRDEREVNVQHKSESIRRIDRGRARSWRRRSTTATRSSKRFTARCPATHGTRGGTPPAPGRGRVSPRPCSG